MSIFTKVPGIYRTREGGYAYVKMICNVTEYPVIGCKAQLMPDNSMRWEPTIMRAYTLDGRCMAGEDQAEDIVAHDSDRVVLIFRPGHPKHTKPCLCRRDGHYQVLWRNMDAWWDTKGSLVPTSDDLEWAELP